ncbi:hypothetical protein [Amycolatopsis alkalitolerans]|uniref:hypothetical protein n=1 Tax=Amycolatopsis alkalitolerans TaxID=2547244 RepID=UPI001359E9BD|nr:hypothetical protein [Amycolatopsis alkalitolerans]
MVVLFETSSHIKQTSLDEHCALKVVLHCSINVDLAISVIPRDVIFERPSHLI